jgi:glycosyltransferase involved in cell wall biosynthesis
MKALFITQTTFLARSLVTHLLNTEDDIDLLLDKKLVGDNINVIYAKKKFIDKVHHIYECVLPRSDCYIGKSKLISHGMFGRIKELLYPLSLNKINKIIEDNKYSYIHINSLIFHKIINGTYPFILHVRERYDGSDPSVYNSLMKASGVIFIDETTYKPFCNLDLKHKIILNNPIDMSPDKINKLKMIIDTNKTIYTVIGRVEIEKGISTIIDAFIKANPENSILLIVGTGETDFFNSSMNRAYGNKNIIFYGIEENIQLIYDISDYIIRGEYEQCVGRTMYEGLYSGCEVIVPGNDMTSVFEREKFEHMIHFYKPLDTNELSTLFKKFDGSKIQNKIYRSNVKEYMQKFNSFIKECLTEI